jgi:hypothetical protein
MDILIRIITSHKTCSMLQMLTALRRPVTGRVVSTVGPINKRKGKGFISCSFITHFTLHVGTIHLNSVLGRCTISLRGYFILFDVVLYFIQINVVNKVSLRTFLRSLRWLFPSVANECHKFERREFWKRPQSWASKEKFIDVQEFADASKDKAIELSQNRWMYFRWPTNFEN